MNRPATSPDALPADAAARLYYLTALDLEPAALLRQAIPIACEALALDYLAVVQGEKGQWRILESSQPQQRLPEALLADALDQGQPIAKGEWYAAPLEPGGGELLAAQRKKGSWQDRGLLDALRQWLARALALSRGRQRDKQQIARQAAILEIAAQWQQTLEMDALLTRMAEASTKLLAAERASIFLWDKAAKTLVGRPALGAPGNELRIPDDAGVVGQVVQTGQPRRVDSDVAAEQRDIDRRVDQKLKFQTRSIVCVPLRGKKGDLFGAFEVLNKRGGNFTPDDEQALLELAAHAAVALENTQQWEQLLAARKQMADQAEQGVQLIGESPAVAALRSTIHRVADTELAVLVLGENGTGKEVVAQMIHYKSRRRQEPFIAVNCAALTETLLESELFGHEKGAFTDAREMRRGKFELAASGTLFLDEIGDMSLGGQAKLLRVLEEKVVVRVGGSTPIPTNTRVIAATNQNLAELVRSRRFREDLYFRLNVVTLDLPPLRERGEDVLLLAEHFLKHFAAQARRKSLKFTAAAKKRMLAHSWPGNVRELRNMMERLAYLAPEEQDKIDAPDLAFILSPDASSAGPLSLDAPLAEATRQFQSEYIQRHIERLRGNMTAAAEKLGLHRSNLYRKMRQLGMEVAEE
ncbi:MAG TPA: sigma-54-dependent Fis family transcriptional regulator [Pirellulaceae bacterium]|nr:sigma-54-dependent Fis family transcriptional regulator [Pirellulaceae bacterium]